MVLLVFVRLLSEALDASCDCGTVSGHLASELLFVSHEEDRAHPHNSSPNSQVSLWLGQAKAPPHPSHVCLDLTLTSGATEAGSRDLEVSLGLGVGVGCPVLGQEVGWAPCWTVFWYALGQWCSTFLVLQPFSPVPHVVVIFAATS